MTSSPGSFGYSGTNTPSNYTLTFDAEFNGGLAADLSQFQTRYPNGDRGNTLNGEQQTYLDTGPFTEADGVLTVHAQPTMPTATADGRPVTTAYSSGILTTYGTYAAATGFFDIRASVPEGQGFWTAFWLYGEPGPGEVDILEQPNTLGNGSYFTSFKSPTIYNQGAATSSTDLSGFHDYGVLITATTAQFYFDGSAIGSVIPNTQPAGLPFYMLADLAVESKGVAWGGQVLPAATADFQIDYIRAYTNDAEHVANLSYEPLSTYIYGLVGHDLAVAHGADTVTLTAGQVINFADGMGIVDPQGHYGDVARLYQAAFNRPPDVAGLLANTAAINAGATLGQVAQGWLTTPEFQSDYAGTSNTDFIARLYANLFHRAPDAGSSGWTAQLDAGASRAQVVSGLAISTENEIQTGATDVSEVKRLYQAAFGRPADADGLAINVNAFKAGGLLQLAQSFIDSAEFKAKTGLSSNGKFVAQLYTNALHRSAGAGEIADWSGRLAGGLSQGQVLIGLSDSLESRMLTSDGTHDGILRV